MFTAFFDHIYPRVPILLAMTVYVYANMLVILTKQEE